MKKIFVLLMVTFLIVSVGCKKEKKEAVKTVQEIEKEEANIEVITFNLEPKSNSEASGVVTFTEENGVVSMSAVLTGLTEGVHAIHIHEKADCSSEDGKSTGGHWNPTHTAHGKWGAETGYHQGDIGNFTADAEGNGTVNMSTDKWCIGCDDETKNIVGKAIIVHAGADDFETQPTGAAGGRVSCGGIIR